MALEMRIYTPTDSGYITEIKWNYDDIKKEVATQAETYATAVYTDDLIKQAKADRAKLNKFVTAIKSRRTEVRKKLLAPDEEFGRQVEEIIGIVNKAITNIDSQVKAYEQKLRDEKEAKIRAAYDEMIGDMREVIPFERIWMPEYANATCSVSKVKSMIAATIETVRNGLMIIDSSDSPYAGDMKKTFLESYDIGEAMKRRNQLEEEAKRRAAYEEERRRQQAERDRQTAEEARKQAILGTVPPEVRQQIQQGATAKVEQKEEEKKWIAFEALLSVHQCQILAAFFKSQGITIRPVNR